ncbi:basic leucine zipper transcriptional factor ATF-like isoform X2 [Narcine bancroftii]|uniref:basic leucine zipper transcriptional factor ATF-like isoform X2 n=1 Tax=Narcine bancroftii TaxID=1343680 RepID=UPI003831590A
MAQDSDSSDSGYSRHQPVPGKQENIEETKKEMRRVKNRLAAQKSRLRQMQKADTLHQESEHLERENVALRKEITLLNEELKYFSAVLRSHESLCPALCARSEDGVHPTHSLSQAHSIAPAQHHL